jgi:hypothetical protein
MITEQVETPHPPRRRVNEIQGNALIRRKRGWVQHSHFAPTGPTGLRFRLNGGEGDVQRETPPQLVATRVRSPEKQNTSFGGGWAPSGTLQTISRGGVRGLLLRQRPSDLFFFLPCIDSWSRITEHCSNSTCTVVSRDDRDRDACFWLCPCT